MEFLVGRYPFPSRMKRSAMTCALSASGNTLGQSLNNLFNAEGILMRRPVRPGPVSRRLSARGPPHYGTGGQGGNQLVRGLEATGPQPGGNH